MIDRFRHRPLYSADNEDSRTELEALEIGRDDTVIAIAAGGGRALSLLTAGPRRLIAVDRRLDQIFQLELKAAAIEAFSYDDLLGFIGLSDFAERLDQYQVLRPLLSPSARRYWDHRPDLIQEGSYTAGRSERSIISTLRTMRALGLMDWTEAFFAAESVEAQLALLDVRKPIVSAGLRWVRLFVNSATVYATAQDPGFLRGGGTGVAEHITRGLVRYAENNLVRESFLLTLYVRGRLCAWDPLPPWLHPQGVEAIRKNLGRMEITNGELADLAGQRRPLERVLWSISDVSCWMSDTAFRDLVNEIVRTSPRTSRICARRFAAPRPLVSAGDRHLALLHQESLRLSRRDASFIYDIESAEVISAVSLDDMTAGSRCFGGLLATCERLEWLAASQIGLGQTLRLAEKGTRRGGGSSRREGIVQSLIGGAQYIGGRRIDPRYGGTEAQSRCTRALASTAATSRSTARGILNGPAPRGR